MIRQLCRNIARFFGGHGGVRNLAVIFIIVAGLLLSCCFVLVAVAGGTPGTIAQATATPGGSINLGGNTPTPTPTTATAPTPTPTPASPTPTPTTSSTAPTPTPTTATTAPTPTPTTATAPTPTPTPAPPTPTPTQPSSAATPTLPPCNGTPTGSVPCKGPGTGGGTGVGPQGGVQNGGTLALVLVGLISLVLIAGGGAAALRIRRARGR